MADKTVRELFGFREVAGEIGIEIEMEGDGLVVHSPSWAEHADGSLRGSSLEYVLKKPVNRDKVSAVLKELEASWKDYGSRLHPSERCGVHVHLNCQKKTLKEVAILMAVYYIFEEPMLKFCGDDRDGNFFCLPARDAEFQLHEIYDMMVNQQLTVTQKDQHYRYAALNITSLAKFGSLEFRPLKATKTLAPVLDWVNIILAINDSAAKFESTRAVVESCSAAGSERFLKQVFGTYAGLLNCKGINGMILDGVRRVQEFAYAPLIVKPKAKKKLEQFEFIDDPVAFPQVQQGIAGAAGNAAPRRPAPPPAPEEELVNLRRFKQEAERLRRVWGDTGTNEALGAYDGAWTLWYRERGRLLNLWTLSAQDLELI